VSGMYPSLMPHWLTQLGALGLFSVSVVDSSVIPLPLPGSTDLLLLGLVAHSGDPWLLAPLGHSWQHPRWIHDMEDRQNGWRSGVAPLRFPARLLPRLPPTRVFPQAARKQPVIGLEV
jgi:hypothetical protein